MKNRFIASVLCLLLICLSQALPNRLVAQEDMPLEKILDRYYATMGGLSAMELLSSIRIKAVLENSTGKLDLTIIKKRPNKVRITFTRGDRSVIQAYDGNDAWIIQPGAKWWEPSKLEAIYARSLIRDAHIESVLVGYRTKNVSLEYGGVVNLQAGIRCYKLLATLPEGDKMEFYLDCTEFVERKIVSYSMIDGRQVEQISYPSDYRKTDGVLVAYKVINWVDGVMDSTIIITSMETNPGVLDSYFKRPATEPLPALN
ncbi:MAG: hypothetical protein SFY80_07235 [Verrucomicrobiota bacterium]|nr:hypothetical protein [Verrucomicrobiota bacterium]